MSAPPVVERLHRSRLGPILRSAESVLRYPLWRARGAHPPAPPHVKRRMLAQYVAQLEPAVFIETGTYRGDTVAKVAKHVPRLVSIELDPTLATLARARFAEQPNVTIVQGDSAELLPEVLSAVHEPALLWLDGHFSGGVTANSGESPVIRELQAVLDSEQAHAVLIDDVRLFDGTSGYPTIDTVLAMVAGSRHDLKVSNERDVLRIVPASTAR